MHFGGCQTPHGPTQPSLHSYFLLCLYHAHKQWLLSVRPITMYNDNRHDVTLVRMHVFNNINMSLYIDDREYFLQNIILFFRNRVCGELWPELSCVWQPPKYKRTSLPSRGKQSFTSLRKEEVHNVLWLMPNTGD